VAQWHHL